MLKRGPSTPALREKDPILHEVRRKNNAKKGSYCCCATMTIVCFYRLAVVNNAQVTRSLQTNAGMSDVMMLSFRCTFQ